MILPAIAAAVLFYVMIVEGHNMMDPDYGSGSSLFGIGMVFIIGVLGMLVAIPMIAVLHARQPAFFQGRTLAKQRAHWVADESDAP